MHIGISRPPTPPEPIPDVDGSYVAAYAEELGFESVFYGEHPVRPVGEPGVGVHAPGVPFFQDTLVTLARASARTTRIRLGSAVFLIPQHHPVLFAKQLASLDFYSGGRLVIGAGVGWSRVECETNGGNFDRRWAQSLEIVEIMKRLWREETVEFHGEFYDFPPVQLFPKPATDVTPPVLLGVRPPAADAATPPVGFRRIARAADGWIPAFVGQEAISRGPDVVATGRRLLAQLAPEHGRDPDDFQITAILRSDLVDGDMRAAVPVGRDVLRRYENAGTERVAISLPTLTNEADARAALEQIAEASL
jgi:probable F420-dependent oxidoreductase